MAGQSACIFDVPELSGNASAQVKLWEFRTALGHVLEYMIVACGQCDFVTLTRYGDGVELSMVAIPVPRNFEAWVTRIRDKLEAVGFELVYVHDAMCSHEHPSGLEVVEFMTREFVGLD